MPVIHAPLNDDDFVDLSNMAREKGMTRSALASYILIQAIRKREQAPKFTSKGIPLAKKLKEISSMSVDGTPMVTMYERQ